MDIKHDYAFDPTCGYSEAELLAITPPPEPEDFRAFWAETRRLAFVAKPQYTVKEIWCETPGDRLYIVRARSWDGFDIGMWVSRPAVSKSAFIGGQGYGNPSAAWIEKDFTVCMPCVRGLGLSQCKEVPWIVKDHIIHGIASRDTYILRGVITDIWLAASVLLDMFPDCAGNLNYFGGSMGGGMGALALPWDDRFKAAYLGVPTFGHNPLRLKFESAGSGESARKYGLEHPEAMGVLNYFDAAISAKYIRIPTVVVPALFDPVVVPPGQFAVANAIPEPFRHRYIADTGHFKVTERDKGVYVEADNKRKELFLAGVA